MSGSWPSTASRPSRSWPAMARWCWRRAAGSMPSSMSTAPAGTTCLDPPARRQGCPSDRQTDRLERTAGRAPAPLPPAPPLPSNGLPAQLDLKGAVRFDLALGGSPADWGLPASFAASAPPAFRAKSRPHRRPGADQPRRHHHRVSSARPSFPAAGPARRRLEAVLAGYAGDRAGQTQRIAFAAEYAGRCLIESIATDWAAPRLVRWYGVE